jgi:hypothetical protein
MIPRCTTYGTAFTYHNNPYAISDISRNARVSAAFSAYGTGFAAAISTSGIATASGQPQPFATAKAIRDSSDGTSWSLSAAAIGTVSGQNGARPRHSASQLQRSRARCPLPVGGALLQAHGARLGERHPRERDHLLRDRGSGEPSFGFERAAMGLGFPSWFVDRSGLPFAGKRGSFGIGTGRERARRHRARRFLPERGGP